MRLAEAFMRPKRKIPDDYRPSDDEPFMNERQRAWAAFRADPEWQEAVRVSEADGPLVERVINKIWNPTPFSPLR